MLICARNENGDLVGFVALKKGYQNYNDLHISEIAVCKDYLRQGIATEMINYILKNSKGYDYVTVDVDKKDVSSANLFSKFKFERRFNPVLGNSENYIFYLRKVMFRKKFTEKGINKKR